MIATVLFTAVMSAIGFTAATSNSCGGEVGWAIPANTALLIILAFIQQRHYKQTSLVERMVNKRQEQVTPPPDGKWKRDDDPVPPPRFPR